jgi:hypothetical protein
VVKLRIEKEMGVRLFNVAIEKLDRLFARQREREVDGHRRLARPALAAGDCDLHSLCAPAWSL